MWVITVCWHYVRLFWEVLHTQHLCSQSNSQPQCMIWGSRPPTANQMKSKGWQRSQEGRGGSNLNIPVIWSWFEDFWSVWSVLTHQSWDEVPWGITLPTKTTASQLSLCRSLYLKDPWIYDVPLLMGQHIGGPYWCNFTEVMMSNTHQLYGWLQECSHTLSNNQGLQGITRLHFKQQH